MRLSVPKIQILPNGFTVGRNGRTAMLDFEAGDFTIQIEQST
jgi:hypothetical protein